jgi:large subunit ribosomal protein L2
MALRKYKAITAGTRWRIGNAYAEVTTNIPEKSLLEKQKNRAGRFSQGARSMRYMGGGNKTMYRLIDFKRDKKDIPATVKTIEHDPNRTAFIALLAYADGEKRYILAPQGLQVGQTVISGDNAVPELGNALMLKNMPLVFAVILAIDSAFRLATFVYTLFTPLLLPWVLQLLFI